MEKSMMLIKSDWNQRPTFKMIPVSVDCPYVECIYDPESRVLALIGTTKKNVFHMMPKLDDNGDIVPRKIKSEGSKTYKEERRTVETFQEYYISDSAEISQFVELFGVNPKVSEEYLAPKEAVV
jgi:hypothetical protein